MSKVTSTFVIVSWAEGVTTEMLTGHDFGNGQHLRLMDHDADADAWAGGNKFLECDLYAAGLNHVAGADVEEWFRSLPWAVDDAAFLVWDDNGEQRGSASVGWVDW